MAPHEQPETSRPAGTSSRPDPYVGSIIEVGRVERTRGVTTGVRAALPDPKPQPVPAPAEPSRRTDEPATDREAAVKREPDPAPPTPTRELRTLGERGDAWSIMGTLAGIGRGPTGGFSRFGLTDEDRAMRDWFEAQAAARGLHTETDLAGNQWAWWRADAESVAAAAVEPVTGQVPGGETIAGAVDERGRAGDVGGQDDPKPLGSAEDAPTDPPDTSDAPGAPDSSDSTDAPDRRAIVLGSHLDSAPNGGAFDGPLGICAAFAAIDRLRDEGFAPVRDIAIVNFLEEEGSRFGQTCLGSRVLTGATGPERAATLRDAEGISLADAWRDFGLPGAPAPDPRRIRQIGRYVELHIEQGIAQADLQAPVAVAAAIWPHGRWRVEFTGQANHAGTTPMRARSDPMAKLARLIEAVREAAVRNRAVATIGKVRIDPGGASAIPGLVTAWIDVRAAKEEAVRAVIGRLAWANPVEESWTPAIAFDRPFATFLAQVVADTRAAACGPRDVPAWLHPRTEDAAPRPVPILGTGAGHDAGILSLAGVSAGMLFVRNVTGISHAPGEHASEEDCEAGVVALTEVLRRLAAATDLDALGAR